MNEDNDDRVEEEIILDTTEEANTEIDPVEAKDDFSEKEENPEAIQEDDAENDDDEDDDRVVSIGDSEEVPAEEEHQEAPGWVKKVRKSNRRLESEVKQLKRQLEQSTKVVAKPIELGQKPSLESCHYDDTKYETELISYYERKRKVDEQTALREQAVQEQQKSWQNKQTRYVELKKEHSFKDYSEAESFVENTLNMSQQQIILSGAEDPALLVYALGKNPKKLDELAGIKDPVEFAFKVAKVESQLKVINKKAPKPEKRVTTGKAGGMSGNGDKTLDRLREEAAKTGDYTKVTAYKRQHRQKGQLDGK